ncbi:hypothetical protein [Desertihabitans aurantiacus]|uniref:hypothetical protein n=1 Tax=Desertihabitans aurantiacus TaxID=2282477 RepID=UPI000DF792B8|nr:hypothetical protein [Desertihabitans aurantiacus]
MSTPEPDTDRPLPDSLETYLRVWCADLMVGMGPRERQHLVQAVHDVYRGGPWPSRLMVQRQAELLSGRIALAQLRDDAITRHHRLTDDLLLLSVPAEHPGAVDRLSRRPADRALLDGVDLAHRQGHLDDAELRTVLEGAAARTPLPDPVPAPPEFPDLPPDHPESWARWQDRDPDAPR